MKKSIFFLILASLFISRINAQSNPVNSTDSISFEKISIDYGTIKQNSSGECEFRYTVKGKNPVVLTNVISSCGCTTPEWPKNPVNPGETGVIKVKYNTALIGRFYKTISVNSTAANSLVVLNITGEVVPK